MSDFFEGLLSGPPDRPDHPDFWKLSDVVLRHDGQATDPTAAFNMDERIARDIKPEVLTYMIGQRVAAMMQRGPLAQELARVPKVAAMLSVIAQASALDAFMIGVEWQKAKQNTDTELLAKALEYLEGVEDEGPYGEGWKSPDLKSLIEEVRRRTEP